MVVTCPCSEFVKKQWFLRLKMIKLLQVYN
jgi:hypothetical protein